MSAFRQSIPKGGGKTGWRDRGGCHVCMQINGLYGLHVARKRKVWQGTSCLPARDARPNGVRSLSPSLPLPFPCSATGPLGGQRADAGSKTHCLDATANPSTALQRGSKLGARVRSALGWRTSAVAEADLERRGRVGGQARTRGGRPRGCRGARLHPVDEAVALGSQRVELGRVGVAHAAESSPMSRPRLRMASPPSSCRLRSGDGCRRSNPARTVLVGDPTAMGSGDGRRFGVPWLGRAALDRNSLASNAAGPVLSEGDPPTLGCKTRCSDAMANARSTLQWPRTSTEGGSSRV